MSLGSRLRVFAVCVLLQAGVAAGVPMLPDDIRELMNQMNQSKLAHVLPADENGGAGPPGDDSNERSGNGERP